MSITTIACQAQGMRAGQVITKLAEDAYFMRVNNRVTQAPPVRNCQHDNEATSCSADIGHNRTRAELPANPNRTRGTAGGPSHGGNSAGGDQEIVPHRDTGGGGSDCGRSNHGADRRAGAVATAAAEATRAATSPAPHVAALTPARKSKNYDARMPPRQATTTASPPSLRDFATYFSRRNSSLWESPSTTRSRIQCSGSDATPSPLRTLVATTTPSASTSPSI
jgi:hypothetical protein